MRNHSTPAIRSENELTPNHALALSLLSSSSSYQHGRCGSPPGPPSSAPGRLFAPLGLLAVLALVVLAGCGSSNGGGGSGDPTNTVASDTAQHAFAAAKDAASKADSVTITGHSSLGKLVRGSVELQLTRDGGQGTIELLGTPYQVLRTGGSLYIKGPTSLYHRLEITKTIPQETWVKLPLKDSAVGAVTDLAAETRRVISVSGKVAKGQITTVEGQPVLELKTEGKLFKGRLYIKTTGEPYPVRLEKSGQETATYTFTNWDKTMPPASPTETTSASG